MANRSFIIAVVLLVGAAILFSGIGGTTGKYVNAGTARNSACADQYGSCVDSALDDRTVCLGQDQKFTCQQRYDYTLVACKQELLDCIR